MITSILVWLIITFIWLGLIYYFISKNPVFIAKKHLRKVYGDIYITVESSQILLSKGDEYYIFFHKEGKWRVVTSDRSMLFSNNIELFGKVLSNQEFVLTLSCLSILKFENIVSKIVNNINHKVSS